MEKQVQKLKNWGFVFADPKECYAVINGELTFVKIVSYIADLVTGKTKYIVTIPNGQETEIEGNGACKLTDFYESKQAFEDGKCIEANEHNHTTVTRILERLNINYQNYHGDCGDYLIPYCWMMVDGEPQKVPVTLKSIKMANMYRFELIPDKDSAVYDVPARYYKDREEVLLWNDYKVKEADGSSHIVKGRLNRFVMTEEQKEKVKAVRDAFEAARAAGVKFCWLSDEDTLQAININAAKEYKNGWEEANAEGFDFTIVSKHLTDDLFDSGVQMYDFWLNCDSYVAVNFK